MIAIFDTFYFATDKAHSACVLSRFRECARPCSTYEAWTTVASEYVPGKFFLRELPCILGLLSEIEDDIRCLIIDGYVWLAQGRPGLGAHLFNSLGQKIPVIGISKNPFHGNDAAVPVLRGRSKKSLFVTAAGMKTEDAARLVKNMHGDHRLPTLVKLADKLSRQFEQ